MNVAQTMNKLLIAGTMSSIFFIQTLSAAPGPLANEPMLTATSVDPNIMLLLDTSGSMTNIVEEAPYDPNVTYFNCPGSIDLNPGSTVDVRVKWSSGNPYFRYGNNLYDWGTTSGNGITGKPKRCFDPTKSYRARLYGNANASWAKYPSGYASTEYLGNYLNWYFGQGSMNWGSTARSKPGTQRRIDVEKTVASQLVNSISNVRMGLTRFNGDYGGRITVGIDDISTNKTSLLSSISGLSAGGNTPLAESLHQIGRYFVQGHNNQLTLHPGQANEQTKSAYTVFNQTPAYSSGVTQASPIQYFCQKSFAIVITDGRPSQDRNISSSTGLQDYDGDCNGATPPCLSYDRKQGQVYESNGSDYLDDVAMALFDIDLRPDLTDPSGNSVKNNVVTYTIGFADRVVMGDPLLKDAAAHGGGQYLTADDTNELVEALQEVTTDISSQVNSATGLAFNGSSLSANSAVYQTRYNSANWTGDLLKIPVDAQGNVGSAVWSAQALLDAKAPSTRYIFTYNEDTVQAVEFKTLANLSAAQQGDLNTSPTGSNDGLGQDRLNYLRGDTSKEGSPFRNRTHIQADFVHAKPAFVGKPDSPWLDYGAFPSSPGNTYSDFKAGSAASRTPMIYVGDNGSMLQGFDGDTGQLVMSYIPSNLFSTQTNEGLHYLTDPAYQHRFYNDLSPVVQDAYVKTSVAGSPKWSTILIAGQRAGGRGYSALDVTNPGILAPGNENSILMWEFNSADDADLGYTFSQPTIGLMNNGRWAAIFGNGYNNTGSGRAKLFIVFLDGGLDGTWTPGTDYIVLDTKRGSLSNLNGMSTTTAVDLNSDKVIDRIYGGDLFGNMWAFDVSSSSTSAWKTAYGTVGSPKPLFNGPGTYQPITTKPIVVKHPEVGDEPANAPNTLVMFGTGEYLTPTDKTNTDTQAFYGVWDSGTGNLNRGKLVRQTFVVNSASKRVMTDKTVPYTASGNDKKYGWRIRFTGGERIITNAIVKSGIVFFSTLIPDVSSPCAYGGSGWLMAVKVINGGEPDEVVLDVNNDGLLSDLDKLNGKVVSGFKFTQGVPLQGVIRDSYIFIPGSDGTVSKFKVLDNQKLLGRISWQDIGGTDE